MRPSILSSCVLLLLAGTPGVLGSAIPPAEDELAKRDDADETYLASYDPEDIIPTAETVKVTTSTVSTGVAQVLPTLADVEPHTAGALVSTLTTSSKPPLLTDPIPEPTSLLRPLTSTTAEEKREAAEPTARAENVLAERAVADIFAVPVATNAPPAAFPRRSDHPVPRKGITKSGPMQTNKFYSNFFLGDQNEPTFTMPYTIFWSKGEGPAASWGLAISHTEVHQRAYGPVEYNNAASYYLNPLGIQSMILSAKELGKNTVLQVTEPTAFSARILLKKDASSSPTITMPIVQGMPYVSGYFSGGTPIIQSGVYFKSMTKVTTNPKANVIKYNFVLMDGRSWRVYAYKHKGDHLDLKVINNGLARATKPFYGIVQIAKDPKTSGSGQLLDDGAGVYPTGVKLTGSVSGSTGTYSFTFTRGGHSTGNLYMYALPHHVASFNAATKSKVKAMKLQTTAKGTAVLVAGNVWTMTETGLPTGMGFAPWDSAKGGSRKALSAAAKSTIAPIALSEVSQDMVAQTDIDSMYFSGKALVKFGQILYIVNDLLGDKPLAQAGLVGLKAAFGRFAANQQRHKLYYETAWGGVVSSATYTTGNDAADFGATMYSDHHFHYGYHILAAAYIAYFDKAWAARNKDYVNMLVRDIANPSTKDTYFPVSRHFDWYHGHSWAHGLYPSLDGKNQESSSEDIMAMYAIKMWGTMIGDTNMVARANLQLAVMARSLRTNYLYTSDNPVMPAKFIGNKVAGIVFENKMHHTTWFSSDIEAIQGIHMIPVHAPTVFSRPKTFIKQEWDTYFSNGRIDRVDNAWKGVIYANYAVIEPKKAWDFFNSSNFQASWIDGGASRTWYMAYAAALGGL